MSSLWSVQEVLAWLHDCGFPDWIILIFHHHQVDGEVFFGESMTLETLRLELGIPSFGVRVKLLMARRAILDKMEGPEPSDQGKEQSNLPVIARTTSLVQESEASKNAAPRVKADPLIVPPKKKRKAGEESSDKAVTEKPLSPRKVLCESVAEVGISQSMLHQTDHEACEVEQTGPQGDDAASAIDEIMEQDEEEEEEQDEVERPLVENVATTVESVDADEIMTEASTAIAISETLLAENIKENISENDPASEREQTETECVVEEHGNQPIVADSNNKECVEETPVINAASEIESPQKVSAPDTVPVKRKRGRPRKTKSPSPPETEDAPKQDDEIDSEGLLERIMKPFLDADHPSMEDFDIEYLRKWLKNPDESLSYDQKCEYFCRQLDDYVEQQQEKEAGGGELSMTTPSYPIRHILLGQMATLSPNSTIKDFVPRLGAKTANLYRFQSHACKIVMERVGMSGFFVRGYPEELLEKQSSAEELGLALDRQLAESQREYYSLMSDLFFKLINNDEIKGDDEKEDDNEEEEEEGKENDDQNDAPVNSHQVQEEDPGMIKKTSNANNADEEDMSLSDLLSFSQNNMNK